MSGGAVLGRRPLFGRSETGSLSKRAHFTVTDEGSLVEVNQAILAWSYFARFYAALLIYNTFPFLPHINNRYINS
jgi:hypothetical protein